MLAKLENQYPSVISKIYAILMTLLSSIGFIGIKMATNTPTYQLAVLRALFSILVSIQTIKMSNVSAWPESPTVKNTVLMRGILGSVFMLCTYQSTKLLNLQITTVLFMLNIPLTVIFSAILGNRNHIVVYIASMACFFGCFLVVLPDIFVLGFSESFKGKIILDI